jgi:hypothetical protein
VLDPKTRRSVALRIKIDDEDFLPDCGKRCTKVDGRGGFTQPRPSGWREQAHAAFREACSLPPHLPGYFDRAEIFEKQEHPAQRINNTFLFYQIELPRVRHFIEFPTKILAFVENSFAPLCW